MCVCVCVNPEKIRHWLVYAEYLFFFVFFFGGGGLFNSVEDYFGLI